MEVVVHVLNLCLVKKIYSSRSSFTKINLKRAETDGTIRSQYGVLYIRVQQKFLDWYSRRMEHNSEFLYDAMNSFDTKSHTSIKVTDVLMATTNVPIYFKTPWYIRGVPYVDGGLGANCSFSVAIPRMQELTDGQLQFGLSVGPSRTTQKVAHVRRSLDPQSRRWFWALWPL